MEKYNVTQIKSRLRHGDVLEIGKITGFHPNYVGQVLLGKIKLTAHNSKIMRAAQAITDAREEMLQKVKQKLTELT